MGGFSVADPGFGQGGPNWSGGGPTLKREGFYIEL